MPVYAMRVSDEDAELVAYMEMLRSDGVNISKYLIQCVNAARVPGGPRPAVGKGSKPRPPRDPAETYDQMARAFVTVMRLLIDRLTVQGVPMAEIEQAVEESDIPPELLAFFGAHVAQEGRGSLSSGSEIG